MRHLPLRTILLPVLITLALHAITFSTALADEWDESYNKGKVALQNGDWNQAITYFQQALQIRSKPEAVAVTSSLKQVEYLPHYFLGQAYLFSGQYQAALDQFRQSEQAGAVKQTRHWKQLQQWGDMTQTLLRFSELQTSSAQIQQAESQFTELQNLIVARDFEAAAQRLDDLSKRFPREGRLAIYRKWLQMTQTQNRDQQPKSPLETKFEGALNLYLLGRYAQALAEFKEIENIDPNYEHIQSWIEKAQTEMQRLNLPGRESSKEESVTPAIIEKTIRETSAPVIVLRTPAAALTEVRSKFLEIAGETGDDQGIAHVAVLVNGEPLVDANGQERRIVPLAGNDPTNFPFSIRIPLKIGENQIALIATDVDSAQHKNNKLLTVIRKPPIYETGAFALSLGSVIVLAIAGFFISKVIKYRIAIVHKYNPYIAGLPIRSAEMFFGREKLIQRILNTLHNNSLMIYGPRRIGKTSLQHQLKARLEHVQDDEFHFVPVMIDLQGTSEERFFVTLMEDILESCKSQLNGQMNLRIHEKGDDYSGRDFSRDLKTVIETLKATTAKKLKLVLLMDEVDELNKYSEGVNQKLRSVFMKTFAENLVAVMSGAYIRKDWESEGSPWYNFFEEMEVPPLEKQEARELILKPVRGIFNYDNEAVEKILEYSQCKPYPVQRFCINVINRIIEEKRRRVTPEDVEAIRMEVMEQ